MPDVDRLVFRAMGTDVEIVVVDGPPGTAATARGRIDDLEARWSRFRPDSEVSRLTASAGRWLAVSADTALLVERARHAWHLTGGAFDPTVLGDVVRAGYTTSWEGPGPRAPGRSDLFTGCGDIEVRPGAVRLPAGTGFDPGGIGKGLAADLVALERPAGRCRRGLRQRRRRPAGGRPVARRRGVDGGGRAARGPRRPREPAGRCPRSSWWPPARWRPRPRAGGCGPSTGRPATT